VVNRIVNGNQYTAVWDVDDLKLSHIGKEVIDDEIKWVETIYGLLSGSKGLQHMYLHMDLDFSRGKLKVSMVPYLQELVDEFLQEIGSQVSTLVGTDLFEEWVDPVLLNKEKAKKFHHIVAKQCGQLCGHVRIY
jgi:hypothetical protein